MTYKQEGWPKDWVCPLISW